MRSFALIFPIMLLIFLPEKASAQAPVLVNHEQWEELLKKNVGADGRVNYRGFIRDSVKLNDYLKLLSKNPPNEKTWSRAAQIAYWINAYNAFTVQMVIRNYPVKSIKDIKKGIAFVNSVWDIKFIKIGQVTYDLNNIEHGILREKFDEPRIHFALNCASVSCPNLRSEAFTADKLERQLAEQTRQFLADSSKNVIAAKRIRLSKIFSWFKGDFTKKGSLIDFLNQYAPVKISPKAQIDFLEYDWRLNE